jgi:hypothetical protein
MATGCESGHTPWATIGKDPSQFFDLACVPPGFVFQDPSRMGLTVKGLLTHLRERQKEHGVRAFYFHHILRNNQLEPAEYPDPAQAAIASTEAVEADIIMQDLEHLQNPDTIQFQENHKISMGDTPKTAAEEVKPISGMGTGLSLPVLQYNTELLGEIELGSIVKSQESSIENTAVNDNGLQDGRGDFGSVRGGGFQTGVQVDGGGNGFQYGMQNRFQFGMHNNFQHIRNGFQHGVQNGFQHGVQNGGGLAGANQHGLSQPVLAPQPSSQSHSQNFYQQYPQYNHTGWGPAMGEDTQAFSMNTMSHHMQPMAPYSTNGLYWDSQGQGSLEMGNPDTYTIDPHLPPRPASFIDNSQIPKLPPTAEQLTLFSRAPDMQSNMAPAVIISPPTRTPSPKKTPRKKKSGNEQPTPSRSGRTRKPSQKARLQTET